ncbi:MAG: glycerophosphodiester phosphodiesterase family protein [Chloroflexales bacterium]|nr:glycerophosphodiester phosphodiesterase family protein [Chloroflexales bacterium]
MTLVIAHRGASAYAPENTLKAFDLAADQGADMCELDVIATHDGALAVFHDDTTGRWESVDRDVRSVSMADMQRLDIRSEKVPHLAAVLDLARERGMQLNVELKHAGIAREVLAAIRDARMHEAVIISSFVGLALREVRGFDATIRMGYLMGSDTYNPIVRFREAYPLFALKSHGCQAWHPYAKLPLIDWAIAHTQKAGYAVNVWTVNAEQDMQKLLALNVAGIITDKPDVLKKIITQGG